MNISFGNKYKNHGESQIRGDGFPVCHGTVPWQARVGFDIYQGGVEGISTQNAEYYGWKYDKKSMPFVKEKFKACQGTVPWQA